MFIMWMKGFVQYFMGMCWYLQSIRGNLNIPKIPGCKPRFDVFTGLHFASFMSICFFSLNHNHVAMGTFYSISVSLVIWKKSEWIEMPNSVRNTETRPNGDWVYLLISVIIFKKNIHSVGKYKTLITWVVTIYIYIYSGTDQKMQYHLQLHHSARSATIILVIWGGRVDKFSCGRFSRRSQVLFESVWWWCRTWKPST